MQVAPSRRVGQGLKVLVRWASAAPLVSCHMVAIWWLSLKAPHPLYPRDYDGEGVVSAPERGGAFAPPGSSLSASCEPVGVDGKTYTPRRLSNLKTSSPRTAAREVASGESFDSRAPAQVVKS